MLSKISPERLAWTVIISAFAMCCVLSLSLPLGGQWWLFNATLDHTIRLTSTDRVLVTRPGRLVPEANLFLLPVGSKITSRPNEQATLVFYAPDTQEVLASVQLYGDTELVVQNAYSPRFELSPNDHWIFLQLNQGRARVVTSPEALRNMHVQIASPNNTYTLIDGLGMNASVEISDNRTIVTVREGEATAVAQNTALKLNKDQLAYLRGDAPPAGPFPAERNLIRNGDFQDALESVWIVDTRTPALPSEAPGSVRLITSDGRRAASFSRSGNNWGQVGIRQEINQDVRDFKSLQLQLDAYIAYQDLYNCGAQGTECPLMVSIRYVDADGAEQEWVQGFFYNYSAQPNFGLTFCVTCPPPRTNHQQVAPNQWITYASPNLLELFRQNARPATLIRSITLYAAGHSFESQFSQVQLLAEE